MLWEPAFFGVRPHVVLKGGMIAWAQMGDANASIPTPQPILPRPMFGAAPARGGRARASRSSRRSRSRTGAPSDLGLGARLVAGGATRARSTKADLPENDALPRRARRPRHVRRDASTASSSRRDPATELPMAQRYFLF